MTSSPSDRSPSEDELNVPVARPTLYARATGVVSQFRQDLKCPLPQSAGLPWWRRLKNRAAHLHRRYGWKLVAGVVAYYLVRDLVLYIILPYLAAKTLF